MKTSPAISLALQGGGSHGAFSWGVADRLLEEGVTIDAVSATSGGAILACVMAQGLLDGGAQGAHNAMEQLWRKVSIATGMLPMRLNPVDKFLGNVGLDMSSLGLDYLTKLFSPYQFNLFDLNPLRGIVDELVDFKALNKKCPFALYINATHAKTGACKIFTHQELTLDAVMASACLPFIFKTVEIDGEPYWDGSFSGCPSLFPLVDNNHAKDIALVQVHPNAVEDVPTAATDILDRVTELSFHSVLLHEIESIGSRARIHRIEAQDTLASLGRASKLNADWTFLTHLHDLGMQAATDWLTTMEQPRRMAGSG